MIQGIGHTAYNVTDMERSLDYYVNKLGFAHAFSLKDAQGSPWIEYVRIPGTAQFIELFYSDDPRPAEGSCYAHLCLLVQDAKAALDELAARGAPITSEITRGRSGNDQFWSADPDGNRIEFMQILPESLHAQATRD